ncbi:ABC transporter permease [Enterococcus caccae ATCC BAA-1240]|uniref:ABC transporter permease n=2 Tax=Enterococcus caccae TaxID=317735 RepID=R3TPN7_9ENTE|nr:ABC transporter permease [Enterococcus caccae ATCC BAA-1240]EOT68121.1 ABC transporter permease [Enterococcus caccae ATCC BAA-1240]
MANETFAEKYLNFSRVNPESMQQAAIDTLFMTVVAMIFVIIIGFLLGLLLYSLSRNKSPYAKICYSILSVVSNIFRSIPYIVLIILLMDFSRKLVGTGIGAKAAIPSLIVSAAPFYARLVEIAFREVDSGVLEAADAMGASRIQKIFKVLIPESTPALLSGVTLTTITMIGFTAMAGIIGGGGLGGLAYQEGFSRNNNTVTLVATVLILVIVFIIQFVGDQLVKRSDKR